MSSPPLQRRKHETGMRRSNEPSSSNGHLPSHLFRTVSSHTMYEDAAHGNVEEVRYERGRSPYELQRRYVAEPMARHLIIDESVEMRNLRERLSAAETHCFGLETTVRSYEREIQKLRVIVNSLIDDFEVVQSRNFR